MIIHQLSYPGIHHTQVQPNETAKKNPSGIEPATSRLEDWYSNHYANETRQLMFLTTYYNNFIYVYKYLLHLESLFTC